MAGTLIASALFIVASIALAQNTPGTPGARSLAQPFRIIAHRGASAYAPENTLKAFQKALELGTNEVELDVQLTRDRQVVVFHDRELDEKTSGRGRVRDRSLAELRKLEIGTWFDAQHPDTPTKFAGTRLASLAEVFEAFGARLFYHIELKGEESGLANRVLALISTAGLAQRVMISSSRIHLLEHMRMLDASIPIALLIGDERELRASAHSDASPTGLPELQRAWIDRAVRSRFNQVAIPAEELTAETVAYAHSRSLEICAYRIRSKQDMEHVIETGANGMTIDWPEWLVERLRGRRVDSSVPRGSVPEV